MIQDGTQDFYNQQAELARQYRLRPQTTMTATENIAASAQPESAESQNHQQTGAPAQGVQAENCATEKIAAGAQLVSDGDGIHQEDGPPGTGGWKFHAEAMERERDYWRQRAQTMHEHQDGQVWYWQGDGNDHPESMVNSLPVVIRADQLRALIAGGVQALSAAPAGWKLVPVNPTPEMWKAAKSVPDPNPPYPPHYGLVWDAMLAASPTPPAEQQAPKAAPTRTALPEGWTDCTIEFGNDGPEVVAYGPKRMMIRLAKWLGKYFAQVIAEAAPKAAPGDALDEALRERDDAEDFIDATLDEVLGHERPEWSSSYGRADALNDVQERMAALHKPAVDKAWDQFQSAMAAPQQESTASNESAYQRGYMDGMAKGRRDAETAPQQEAQEPCGWTTGITWRPDTRLQSEQVIKITRDTQPKYGYTTPIYTAPQPAPAPLSDDVVRDAARYRWLRATTNYVTSNGERIDVRNMPETWDVAIDAALAAQKGK